MRSRIKVGLMEMRRETQIAKRVVEERGVEFLEEGGGEDEFGQRRGGRRQRAERDEDGPGVGRVGGQQIGQLYLSRVDVFEGVEVDEDHVK